MAKFIEVLKEVNVISMSMTEALLSYDLESTEHPPIKIPERAPTTQPQAHHMDGDYTVTL